MNKILSVENIGKKYNTINGEIEAIKNISFDVNEGEFIALVGSSGCGKSTLLSILAGLDKQSVGKVSYHINNPVIGYMLQEDALFPHYSILDNVLLGLKIQNKLNKENKEYAINLLKKYITLSDCRLQSKIQSQMMMLRNLNKYNLLSKKSKSQKVSFHFIVSYILYLSI